MQTSRWLILTLGLTLAAMFIGCGGSAPAPKPASQDTARANDTSAPPYDSEGPAEQPGAADSAPHAAPPAMASPAPASAAPTNAAQASPGTGAAKAGASSEALKQAPSPKERPGLATQFGEDLSRGARRAQFERESMTAPFLTTTIWYNDATGAQAMAQRATSRTGSRAEVELLNGGLVVAITDEWFRVLDGFTADGRPYAIGEANARYAIRITNRTEFSFEIVASVDGLDVINGKPASFERRGYILSPRDTMSIEGFRTSESTIAAFRFGKVSESYTVQMGRGDRNVGVIGVGFFQERGKTPIYPSEDVRLRQDANPFPGEYAPRPKARPPETPLQQR